MPSNGVPARAAATIASISPSALNPAMVEGQSVGGLVQGLGGTLLDHMIYDEDGQLLTTNLADYLLPMGQSGVQVWSLQEPWTEAGGELLDLLLAIAGRVARMESNRRSERTKAGLQRAVSQGKRLGRPPGSNNQP